MSLEQHPFPSNPSKFTFILNFIRKTQILFPLTHVRFTESKQLL
jgi:hypothetical protein